MSKFGEGDLHIYMCEVSSYHLLAANQARTHTPPKGPVLPCGFPRHLLSLHLCNSNRNCLCSQPLADDAVLLSPFGISLPIASAASVYTYESECSRTALWGKNLSLFVVPLPASQLLSPPSLSPFLYPPPFLLTSVCKTKLILVAGAGTLCR